jgi:hypothetical protein
MMFFIAKENLSSHVFQIHDIDNFLSLQAACYVVCFSWAVFNQVVQRFIFPKILNSQIVKKRQGSKVLRWRWGGDTAARCAVLGTLAKWRACITMWLAGMQLE